MPTRVATIKNAESNKCQQKERGHPGTAEGQNDSDVTTMASIAAAPFFKTWKTERPRDPVILVLGL